MADIASEPDAASFDVFENKVRIIASEGAEAVEQLVEEDAERPDVDALVVAHVVDDLGSHVLVRAAEGHAHVFLLLADAPAEIADLEAVVLREKQIFRLRDELLPSCRGGKCCSRAGT